MKSDICIVVIGYNRSNSLARCLNRLNECYFTKNVDLYISVDNSTENIDTVSIADSFVWKYGDKFTVLHKNRLGLRKHVLTCGDIVNNENYNGIIMLEDDIYVAKDFFTFASQCIRQYDNCLDIAGISLYNHSWNINSKLPFYPIFEGDDVYFMQYAQSWGQAWSKRMWNDFINWYNQNNQWDNSDITLPRNVLNWPDSSWLKYFIKYCCKNKKYFVYPYQSLSTNFSDIGEHNTSNNKSMQRSLSASINHTYRLPSLHNSKAIYDCFFENLYLTKFLGYDNLCIDLYGKKQENKKYILTTKHLNYKILKKYAMDLKPIELNILNDLSGEEIFLYDSSKIQKNVKNNSDILNYYWQDYDLVKSFKLIFKKICYRFLCKIKKG